MSHLTLLNLEAPKMRADYESNAPTGMPSMADVEAWEGLLIGLRSHTGQVVTPERAKRCGAVLACMRGISEDLSALPIPLFKRGPNGDEHAIDHNLYSLLNVAPNELMTGMELREHIIFDLILNGNFYVLKNEDPENPGAIGSLWPLQANYVTRLSREAFWTYTDPLTGVSGNFIPGDVWRGTIMSGNGLDGVALTLLAREAIGLLLAAEEQGARLFSQGVQTELAISSDDTVDADGKKQLREAFMRRHAGSGNSWMPLLLEGGLKASRLGLTAQESQYLEARAFQVADIARMFRYPEVLLGSSGKGSKASTYASAEQFFQSYTKHTLTPWAVRIEQTAHRDLLTTKERAKFFFRHDFSSLLRADTAARYAAYATGIQNRFISPAEARRSENLPYDPGCPSTFEGLANISGKPPADSVKPTDESASGSDRRIAAHILRRENKALVLNKQDTGDFYSHFGGFIEGLTGASTKDVLAYLDTRRATADRFSADALSKATDMLIALCKKDK